MIIGIDPGCGGAMVLLATEGAIVEAVPFGKATWADVARTLRETCSREKDLAVIENVHSMPRQGVASTFKFGKAFGIMIGILTALEIRWELVVPGVWQRDMKCLSGGDKNVTKARAQMLFPRQKMTHAVADAFLIAEWARRKVREGAL